MASVVLRRIEKVFPNGSHAVRALDLSLEDGEFMVLVGPSGSGKTTILRMIAGLEGITGGEILLNGKTVNRLPPRARDVAMVFQNHVLYPHLSVRGNLEFPLRLRKIGRAERERRVRETAELLGLSPWLDARPTTLSGGQRQRVAIGRCLVRRPAVFLLDEPLAQLDAPLRAELRAEIARLQRQLRTTTLYVTHDQAEAMALGDRLAVLAGGRLQQEGTSRELYDRPANVFVARFLGSPGMNIFPTLLFRAEGGRLALDIGGRRLRISPKARESLGAVERLLGVPLFGGLRPEAFSGTGGPREGLLESLLPLPPNASFRRGAAGMERASEENTIGVKVAAVERFGHETIVYFDAPSGTGSPIFVSSGPDSPAIPANSTTPRMAARLPAGQPIPGPGSHLELNVDTSRLCLFDTTGNRL
jgi:multiple sugar transport system ATP-binding protein